MSISSFFAEASFELLGGGAEGEVGLGADEVHDGLGLGEVHLAIEECALGEFAGLRGARASGEEELQDAAGDEDAAVAGDLDDVLAGVAGGGAEEGEEDVVDDGGAVEDFAELLEARLTLRGFGFALEDFIRDGDGARAADAEEGDGAFAERGADGGYGVVHGRVGE